jgi:7-cyano-7-deazaguanine synthase
VNLSVCALVSGGLDSCVLVAELAKTYRRVYPVFIRQGLVWERAELRQLRRYLRAIGVAPLTVLDLPVGDLYGSHWSVTGRRVPGAKTRDEAVYLPGRNLMLLSKAAVFCELHKIPVMAVGSLGHNPFPDATPSFFCDFARVSGVKVIAPFRRLTKLQVVRRGRGLPLHLSFSCLAPKRGQHCGRCNKCAERQRALRLAEVVGR